ncbi:hypothetical protein MHU86_1764 [Fragilaria crotonensis]|nr:hypothetical protein MHU86_1764 [Fragilaria crotonensis]
MRVRVSVTKLKGWLDDFGKKQRNHFEKVTMIGHVPVDVSLQKPTRPRVQVAQPLTSRTIKRTTEQMKEARKGPTMTPVRFKSRLEDKVQATDNGYASVKELSAWLAGDPTTKKAVRGSVRRGVNVINKSRMFEKDLEDVIIEEVGLHRGDVTNKKEWLEHQAFQENNCDNDSDFDRRSAVTELVSVQDKKKWLHSAFGGSSVVNGGSVVDGGRDSRTVVSVTDKREWLNKAFKKGSERMMELGANEHDSATPAKKKWQAHAKRRSSRQLGEATKSPVPRSVKDPQTTSKESTHRETILQTAAAASTNGANQLQPVVKAVVAPIDSSAAASRSIEATETINNDANNQNQHPQPGSESPAYDFKTARQLLVQRSAANGNPVKVLTKVQMKKNKFERLQKEVMKGTGPKGLLKPSWEQGSGIEKPADQYVKTFIPDIAPKKSFEELP